MVTYSFEESFTTYFNRYSWDRNDDTSITSNEREYLCYVYGSHRYFFCQNGFANQNYFWLYTDKTNNGNPFDYFFRNSDKQTCGDYTDENELFISRYSEFSPLSTKKHNFLLFHKNHSNSSTTLGPNSTPEKETRYYILLQRKFQMKTVKDPQKVLSDKLGLQRDRSTRPETGLMSFLELKRER